VIYSKDARDTALELMSRFGFWPVAIHPGSKIPIGWSKAPAKPTEESIRATYAAYPDAGVGIITGRETGIIDIEFDGHEAGGSMDKLMGGNWLIEGLCLGWNSPRGMHQLYKYDSRLAKYGLDVITMASLPDLEIRIGGIKGPLQSNCPPTKGSDGKPREWVFSDRPIGTLPEAFFAYLDAHQAEMDDESAGSPNTMSRSANDEVELGVAVRTLINAFARAFQGIKV
jgi:hypothetical protein